MHKTQRGEDGTSLPTAIAFPGAYLILALSDFRCGEMRWGQLQACPPGVDDHVVGDAGVDGVMQARLTIRSSRGWNGGEILAQHGAEGIDERLPEAGPVGPGRTSARCSARPGPDRWGPPAPQAGRGAAASIPCVHRIQPYGPRTAGGPVCRWAATASTTARGPCGRRCATAAGLADERPGTGSCPGHGRHQSVRRHR